MPFTVYCGACRQPLTCHEGQTGQVVACPLCRSPFAVPGALQPVPAPQLAQPQLIAWDASQVAEDEPPRPRYRQSSNLGVLVAVGLAALFLVAATALAGWWVLRGQKDETVKATPPTKVPTPSSIDTPPKPQATTKHEPPARPVDEKAARLRALDREGMELIRSGELVKGMEKLIEASKPYKQLTPADCTIDECIEIAIIYARVASLSSKSLPEDAVLGIITIMGQYLEKGGIHGYSAQTEWFRKVVDETAEVAKQGRR